MPAGIILAYAMRDFLITCKLNERIQQNLICTFLSVSSMRFCGKYETERILVFFFLLNIIHA